MRTTKKERNRCYKAITFFLSKLILKPWNSSIDFDNSKVLKFSSVIVDHQYCLSVVERERDGERERLHLPFEALLLNSSCFRVSPWRLNAAVAVWVKAGNAFTAAETVEAAVQSRSAVVIWQPSCQKSKRKSVCIADADASFTWARRNRKDCWLLHHRAVREELSGWYR